MSRANYEEIERLRALLKRVKETFEPFPVVSDLKSLTDTLRKSRLSKKEQKNTKLLYEKRKAEYRKLYKDIEQALKPKG